MQRLFVVALATAFGVSAQETHTPTFEVATVRPSVPDTILNSYVPALKAAPGSTLRIQNRQLQELIMIAYGVGVRQLEGPSWLINTRGNATEAPRFDILAKVPAGATEEQIPAMLRNLLAERFKLRIHTEQRAMTIYALEVGKRGFKIQPEPDGEGRQSGCARNMFGAQAMTTAVCRNMTPAQLAQQLQTLSPAYFPDGPVLDKTGLNGVYTFSLEWITLQQKEAGEEGPSMFEAIEKLGLHIAKQKGEAPVLVVDNIERMPTDN